MVSRDVNILIKGSVAYEEVCSTDFVGGLINDYSTVRIVSYKYETTDSTVSAAITTTVEDLFGNKISITYNREVEEYYGGKLEKVAVLDTLPKNIIKEFVTSIPVEDRYGNYVFSINYVKGGNKPFTFDKYINISDIEKYIKDKYNVPKGYHILTDYEQDIEKLEAIEIEGFTFIKTEPSNIDNKKCEAYIMRLEEDLENTLKIIDNGVWIKNNGILKREGTDTPPFKEYKVFTGAKNFTIDEFANRVGVENAKKELTTKLYNLAVELNELMLNYKESTLFTVDAISYIVIVEKRKKQININIPKKYMGLAIGKKGANIKRVSQELGCKINLNASKFK